MSTKNRIWVNGKLLPAGKAMITPFDRGFTLGDGLFETMRVYEGEILHLERHLARLRRGARVLGIPIKADAELHVALQQTLTANGFQQAFLRLTVSRGVSNARGLLPGKNPTPSLVIQCGEFGGYSAEYYQRGMGAVISSIRRNEHSPLSNIKSLNYLDNILARQEAVKEGADEALLLNSAGQLVCASAANLFFVMDDTLYTAPLSSGALPGTIRSYLIEDLARLNGLQVIEHAITPDKLEKVNEAFLTNVLMGIMPLVTVNGKSIKNGKPGKITRSLCRGLELKQHS